MTAEAKTTLVHYDYSIDKSRPIGEEVKQALLTLTGE